MLPLPPPGEQALQIDNIATPYCSSKQCWGVGSAVAAVVMPAADCRDGPPKARWRRLCGTWDERQHMVIALQKGRRPPRTRGDHGGEGRTRCSWGISYTVLKGIHTRLSMFLGHDASVIFVFKFDAAVIKLHKLKPYQMYCL